MTVQQSMGDRNKAADHSNSHPGIVFRIGIKVGDIIIDGVLFGDGVNMVVQNATKVARA
jgi:hypothetical protein